MHDRSRTPMPGLAVLAALLAMGCGGGSVASHPATATATATASAPTAAATSAPTPLATGPAGLYDLGGGRKLFLECIGAGSPTIVIDVGNDDTIHGSWGQVFQPMAAISQTCAYDRANLGRSDRVAGPRTVEALSEDLYALLQASGIPGPYVFVGGSFGGNLISVLAANHPDVVAGLVYIDSEPATKPADNPFLRNIPESERNCCQAPAWDAPENTEHIDFLGGIDAELAAVGKQPHVPAIVLTATQLDCEPSWPCDTILADELALQARWIEGNPSGTQIKIASDHIVQRHLPAAIIDAARTVVEQVRGG